MVCPSMKSVVNKIVSLILVSLLCMVAYTSAEILHETGSLKGFLGGSCSDCAYDNWISHISEGIANPGLNDYGPTELDPQTTGFGQFALIPNDSAGDQIIPGTISSPLSFKKTLQRYIMILSIPDLIPLINLSSCLIPLSVTISSGKY